MTNLFRKPGKGRLGRPVSHHEAATRVLTVKEAQAKIEMLEVRPMQAIKQEALNAIGQLPDDADMEEIMYRLYVVLENVRRGREDAAQNNVTPVEQVLRDIQTW